MISKPWKKISQGSEINIQTVYLLFSHGYPPFLGVFFMPLERWLPVVLDPIAKKYVLLEVMGDHPQPHFYQELVLPYIDLVQDKDGVFVPDVPPAKSI